MDVAKDKDLEIIFKVFFIAKTHSSAALSYPICILTYHTCSTDNYTRFVSRE